MGGKKNGASRRNRGVMEGRNKRRRKQSEGESGGGGEKGRHGSGRCVRGGRGCWGGRPSL